MAGKAKKAGRSKKKQARAKMGFFTKVLVVVLLAALAWQLVTLRRQVADAEFRKEALSQEVQQRQEENASLQESIDQGGSLEEMLRIAREKLGLVAPNEKVFYDTAN